MRGDPFPPRAARDRIVGTATSSSWARDQSMALCSLMGTVPASPQILFAEKNVP